METLISNDLDSTGGTTRSSKSQQRLFVSGIMMYEIERPLSVEFKKGEFFETVTCFNYEDEAKLNDIIALLNDLVKGDSTHTIYNDYKADLPLQQMLRISNSIGTRVEEFAKSKNLVCFTCSKF